MKPLQHFLFDTKKPVSYAQLENMLIDAKDAMNYILVRMINKYDIKVTHVVTNGLKNGKLLLANDTITGPLTRQTGVLDLVNATVCNLYGEFSPASPSVRLVSNFYVIIEEALAELRKRGHLSEQTTQLLRDYATAEVTDQQ